MKTLSLGTIALIAATLLSSCAMKPSEKDIIVLYTTDVHGAYLPFDIRNNMPAVTSMANVCTYVNQQRLEYPDAVFLFEHDKVRHVVRSHKGVGPNGWSA